ncbi:5'/3'-nucleotidase SurE [Rhodoferax sp.]|uniref:5'/3'-nucleotidase SurE n=1 Tax=Rhodoferax sp. TaxID=50421 RepID=UPI00374D9FFC
MKTLLLSNDDGFDAPGLQALYAALSAEYSLQLAAPDRNCSGVAGAVTLSKPLRVQQRSPGQFCLDGTPVDCVRWALSGGLAQPVAMVVSGINLGPNMGDDTFYSGTLAAAREGLNFGLSALAISMDAHAQSTELHYATAGHVAAWVLRAGWLSTATPQLLNINVPNLPLAQLKGIKVCRLGARAASEGLHTTLSPRGETVVWHGRFGAVTDAGPDTDYAAVADGWASVTPIQLQGTDHALAERLSSLALGASAEAASWA